MGAKANAQAGKLSNWPNSLGPDTERHSGKQVAVNLETADIYHPQSVHMGIERMLVRARDQRHADFESACQFALLVLVQSAQQTVTPVGAVDANGPVGVG